jgi:hypothetical protein
MEFWHASNAVITNPTTPFFAYVDKADACKKGEHLYQVWVKDDDVLSYHHFHHKIDYETLKKLVKNELKSIKNDAEIDKVLFAIITNQRVETLNLPAKRILNIFKKTTFADAQAEAWRLKGVFAQKLGYKAVQMRGYPGCEYLVIDSGWLKYRGEIKKS